MSDFTNQIPVEMIFCGYEIQVPSSHPILTWHSHGNQGYQLYREGGLALVSCALQMSDKKGTVIDIGANIGDTLAIIARNSSLNVHCVEASDFFSTYLTENITRHFETRATFQQCFVTRQTNETPFGLEHWGGTARPVAQPF